MANKYIPIWNNRVWGHLETILFIPIPNKNESVISEQYSVTIQMCTSAILWNWCWLQCYLTRRRVSPNATRSTIYIYIYTYPPTYNIYLLQKIYMRHNIGSKNIFHLLLYMIIISMRHCILEWIWPRIRLWYIVYIYDPEGYS